MTRLVPSCSVARSVGDRGCDLWFTQPLDEQAVAELDLGAGRSDVIIQPSLAGLGSLIKSCSFLVDAGRGAPRVFWSAVPRCEPVWFALVYSWNIFFP